MYRLSWFLDPGDWSKAAVVGLYFIFPGICTLSLASSLSGLWFLVIQAVSSMSSSQEICVLGVELAWGELSIWVCLIVKCCLVFKVTVGHAEEQTQGSQQQALLEWISSDKNGLELAQINVQVPWIPEEGIRSPEARVTISCEQPDIDVGNWTRVL
ncbi:hypothetical protein STEG23_030349 [Scotinomys teguina]